MPVSLVCYVKGKYLHSESEKQEKEEIPPKMQKIDFNEPDPIEMVWFIRDDVHSVMSIPSNFIEKQPDGDVSSAIRNTLSASLNNGTHNGLNSLSGDANSLQNQMVASSKLALISPIDYEEVNNFKNSVQDIKSKYIVLKPQSSSGSNASATITSNSSNTNGKALTNGSLADKSNNGTGKSHFIF